MKVNGKAALITGAARGIGLGYAKALLAKGAKVCISDVLDDVGRTAVAELQAEYGKGSVIYTHCDVSVKEDVEELFKRTKETFGRLDIVINNAGVVGDTPDKWEKTLDINLKGAIRAIYLGLEYMGKDQGGEGGVIVSTGSFHCFVPAIGWPTYCAAKHGLLGITRSFADQKHFERTCVRLNIVLPAVILTDIVNDFVPEKVYFADEMWANKEEWLKHPEDHFSPEEVAPFMMELVEDDTKNGQALMCSKRYGKRYIETPTFPY